MDTRAASGFPSLSPPVRGCCRSIGPGWRFVGPNVLQVALVFARRVYCSSAANSAGRGVACRRPGGGRCRPGSRRSNGPRTGHDRVPRVRHGKATRLNGEAVDARQPRRSRQNRERLSVAPASSSAVPRLSRPAASAASVPAAERARRAEVGEKARRTVVVLRRKAISPAGRRRCCWSEPASSATNLGGARTAPCRPRASERHVACRASAAGRSAVVLGVEARPGSRAIAAAVSPVSSAATPHRRSGRRVFDPVSSRPRHRALGATPTATDVREALPASRREPARPARATESRREPQPGHQRYDRSLRRRGGTPGWRSRSRTLAPVRPG